MDGLPTNSERFEQLDVLANYFSGLKEVSVRVNRIERKGEREFLNF